MLEREAMSPAVHVVVALTCALATGCACVRQAQKEPVPTSPPAASIPVAVTPIETAPEAEPTPAVVEAPKAPATPAAPPPTIEPARPAGPAPATRTVVPKAPVAVAPPTPVIPSSQPPKPVAAVTVAPAPAPAVAARSAPAAPQPAAAPLDLKSLATRLRQTSAIGVLTKLSLKNQVDDLVDQFRAYHKRQGTATLAELRRGYDMLLLKVLSLLQDSDPSLARDIVKSRAAIWSILEDPRKFTESNLMAGVIP